MYFWDIILFVNFSVETALENMEGEVIMVEVGDSVSIMCKADGIPEPRLVWRHNNNLVLLGEVVGGIRWQVMYRREEPGYRTYIPTAVSISSNLTITRVMESDNHTQLSCSAYNGIGRLATLTRPYTLLVHSSGGLYTIMHGLETGGSLKTSLKENNFHRRFDQMLLLSSGLK